MEQRIDAFCHILPKRYDEARWKRHDKTKFTEYSPAHIKKAHVGGERQLNYEVLTDLDARFRMIEEFEGYRQVLSVASPPPEVVDPDGSDELCKILNDELAALVAKHPHHFVGAVANVPMNKPDAAARELERALNDLKLNGVQLFSSVLGKPLDLPEFRPIFEIMAKHDRPILLHPTRPRTRPDYPTEDASKYIIWQVFGWPYESTAAMTRIVFGGILEDFPDLKIIVHHTGAMIPFFNGRLQAMYTLFEPLWKEERGGLLKRPVVDYFRKFYGDTSVFTAASVECAADFFGPDHVIFGTDAPFDIEGGRFSVRESTKAVQTARLSEQEKSQIFAGAFERLFRLKAAQ